MSHMGDRGFIDYDRTDMEPCTCGAAMTGLTLGYGRTPYGIYCGACGTSWLNWITNVDVKGAVRAWNDFRKTGNNPYEIRAFKSQLDHPAPEAKPTEETGASLESLEKRVQELEKNFEKLLKFIRDDRRDIRELQRGGPRY